ncbi:MAG: DMT family transporter [Pseudomonadota bacterium]|nr:DMT family transporter [Pseudomonadota bacterium]
MSASPDRRLATATGCGAVALWALLALLTVRSGAVPPFQLTALCLALGAGVGLVWARARGRPLAAAVTGALAGGPRALALGIGGIFGYHFFYFTALRGAPAAEAGLIAYLWPLLIVLFSGLLPGERLRPLHILGALAALAGAALILAPRLGADAAGGGGFDPRHSLGFGAALLCALIWSGYSVLSRRMGEAPTEAVAVYCAAGAVLSALAHLALETTVWPAGPGEWAAVVGLGLGPLGLAFYVWDYGVRRGDIQLLGVAAYAAPLLSTLALAAAGEARLTGTLALSAGLIAGGAALAALGSRRAGAAPAA